MQFISVAFFLIPRNFVNESNKTNTRKTMNERLTLSGNMTLLLLKDSCLTCCKDGFADLG